MPKTLYILNGPNLNLLGSREPEIYGSQTLGDIEALCASHARAAGYSIVFRQTNIEGELVDYIQEGAAKGVAILINPAAYTHTSVALYDAIKAVNIPVIEVHLSQPAAREDFRQISYVSAAAKATISGMGAQSYILGLDAIFHALKIA
ncbi:MAG: type II 3-dehydroquinate dehydratase [Robiginitomaculum sp.]